MPTLFKRSRGSLTLQALSALIAGLAFNPTQAQVIERLADIETGPGPQVSSNPGGFFGNQDGAALADGRVVFSASDPAHGRELWLTTGASAVLVKDIMPGTGSGNPDRPVAFSGRVWFAAADSDSGVELWVTDGSPGGTRRAMDLRPGPDSSQPEPLIAMSTPALLFFSAFDANGAGVFVVSASGTTPTRLGAIRYCGLGGLPQRVALLGTRVLFPGNAGNGCEPFISDGTPAGTFALGDLNSGAANSNPRRFVAVGARAFFTANTAAAGRELWVTDGTAAGTRMVFDLAPGTGSSDPEGLIAFGNNLLFVARDAASPRRLQRSDGNAIEVIEPLAGFTAAGDTVAFGAEVCFSGRLAASGSELWCSDGSAIGTRLVSDLLTGTASSSPEGFLVVNTALGSRLFYTARSSVDSRTRLAVSNGTGPGTIILDPAATGLGDIFFASVGGQALASNADASGDVELWRSDGSVLGTTRIADIGSAPGSSLISRIEVTASGHRGYFAAFRTGEGYELWRTDGSTAGTLPIIDLASGPTSGIPVESFGAFNNTQSAVAFGEKFLFVGNDGISGAEPWITDGTAAGTQRLAETLPGNNAAGSGPQFFAVLGDRAYFFAATSIGLVSLSRLFRTDGTAAGTVELTAPVESTRFIGPWMPAAGTLFIAGERSSDGQELWRINAAGDALEPVADLAAGTTSTQLRGGVAVSDALLFAGTQTVSGTELYRSDGSALGTLALPELIVGNQSGVETMVVASAQSSIRNAIRFGARAFFPCRVGDAQGTEPCVSDGTGAGTMAITDLEPGPAASSPVEPVTDGERVWFIARRNGQLAVHSSDGSATGTSTIETTRGIVPSNLLRLPNGELVMAGNFVLGNSDFGRELFAGEPGAVRAFNLAPGELGSNPAQIVMINGHAVFSAATGATGNEPHVYKSESVFQDSFE